MLTLANLATSMPGVLMTIAQFLVVLTIVVFVHEFGHFIVARWCGVTVKTFSIGFGREIFGFTDRKGTRWRFAWIPLGGYVKFVDDENAASQPSPDALDKMTAAERQGAFQNKPLWQRAAVVAAGPIANFILAIMVYAAVNVSFGVRTITPVVGEVKAGMPAAAAGIQSGDVIRSIDDWTVEGFEDVQRLVGINAGRTLKFGVERNGEKLSFDVTPEVHEQPDSFGGTFRRGLIGITPSSTDGFRDAKSVGVVEALRLGVRETYANIAHTIQGISDIITQRQAADQMGGPILMAQVTARVAEGGIEPLLRWVAFISANIGFLNLLPIPVLDGGHLVYYAIEGVMRRPLSRRMQEIGFQIGIALVLMLMVYVNLNDLLRVWRGWTGVG
ncbi:Membrane-associated zinc metalloprotease [Hyphomicrobium sulfonivorans]|uniref:Zinc metalloprotease n=1 Tax=Hyphomicrobium sulfonivorans TaxID=121290 RepID=A0A109BK50_HYPSL|nr:RIP metalloprotease RseP [Hyphomicrobium sulfonivorans]KWT70194.1 Membrane-associated zinc metalloprotease [Hyphomicrobium sulfonivorans]